MYTVNNSEQLRELSSNDLNFLENHEPVSGETENGRESNSTVRDLDNILDRFQADAQLLLENPNELLNCKYHFCLFSGLLVVVVVVVLRRLSGWGKVKSVHSEWRHLTSLH